MKVNGQPHVSAGFILGEEPPVPTQWPRGLSGRFGDEKKCLHIAGNSSELCNTQNGVTCVDAELLLACCETRRCDMQSNDYKYILTACVMMACK
jgi:hypothetical protein